MAQAHYQITLSLDGNHAVSVTGDDPTQVQEGLAWARGIYLKLKERSAAVSNSAGVSETSPAAASSASTVYHHDIAPVEPAPICAIHHQPMVRVSGRRGEFWSCHEKLDDGSYCPYRPPK
jgi:hypothetical protein